MKPLTIPITIFGIIFISIVKSDESNKVSHIAPLLSSSESTADFPLEDKALLTPEEKRISGEDDDEIFGKVEPGPDYRLPTSLIPRNYYLKIRPILDKDYEGLGKKNTAPSFVSIRADCVESTKRVVLHSKFLQINESSIEVVGSSPNQSINVASVDYDELRDFLIINLESELRNGENVRISMEYIANVPPNSSLRGLYTEEYLDPLANKTKLLAVTQLEPLRARQVLPCMDEPTYKATFSVGIGRTVDYNCVLSNSPYMRTEQDPEHLEWWFDYFQETVPMPTYLLALAVSDFEFNEAPQDLYRLPVKVYGPPHLVREGKGQLTANATAMLMTNFERKLGVPHNNPKVDSITVPRKGGAMENYGLITYGEHFLMYYEGITTSKELRNIYNILAHELAHQWFGNLVTCEWWSDIWLNEGFASYMSYAGQHDLWPEFDMMTYMVSSSVNSALQYDAGPSSHPVHNEAYSAKQVANNMDAIGYKKGAALVRMMVSFLGENVFYDGINQYLRKHYDSVVRQDYLFEALNEFVRKWAVELPKNVTEIMNTWTLQKGFPLVRVSHRGLDGVVISQECWENADVRNETSDPGSSWDIPIKYLAKSSSQETVDAGSTWLLKEEKSKILPIQNATGWVLLNPDAGGYYRTLYDQELARRITTQLLKNHLTFPAPARVRLLDDQLNLGFQHYIPIKSALEFMKYLQNERDPTVWPTVFKNFADVKNFYRNVARVDQSREDIAALNNFLGAKILAVLNNLDETIHENPSSHSILRTQLLKWSCSLDLKSSSYCDVYAAFKLGLWQNNPSKNPIPTDIQSTLYCKMVERDSAGYEWLLEQYFMTNDTFQKTRMSTALGCTRNETQIADLLQLILHPTGSRMIEKDHSTPIFKKLLTHSWEGVSKFGFIFHANPDQIPNYYDGDLKKVMEILESVDSHYATEADLNMVQAIKDSNPDFYKDSLDPVLTNIEKNMKWLETFRKDMTSWFKENLPKKSHK